MLCYLSFWLILTNFRFSLIIIFRKLLRYGVTIRPTQGRISLTTWLSQIYTSFLISVRIVPNCPTRRRESIRWTIRHEDRYWRPYTNTAEVPHRLDSYASFRITTFGHRAKLMSSSIWIPFQSSRRTDACYELQNVSECLALCLKVFSGYRKRCTRVKSTVSPVTHC